MAQAWFCRSTWASQENNPLNRLNIRWVVRCWWQGCQESRSSLPHRLESSWTEVRPASTRARMRDTQDSFDSTFALAFSCMEKGRSLSSSFASRDSRADPHVLPPAPSRRYPVRRRRAIGIILEAPIPKMSGLVRTNNLFSKAFINEWIHIYIYIYITCSEALSPKLILGIGASKTGLKRSRLLARTLGAATAILLYDAIPRKEHGGVVLRNES